MTYYYMTKSKGRAGCSNSTWRKAEANSKAEVKNRYKGMDTRVAYIYSNEELELLPEDAKNTIKARAV